jgi:hypothetical protein
MASQDILVALLILFVFAISSILGFVVYERFVIAASPVLDQPTAQAILTTGETMVLAFDFAFLLLFLGLVMLLVLSAIFIRTHPAFFFISIMLLGLYIVIAAPLANSYIEFSEADAISAAVTNFPIIDFVMNNMPLFTLFMGAVFILALYAKGGSIDAGF